MAITTRARVILLVITALTPNVGVASVNDPAGITIQPWTVDSSDSMSPLSLGIPTMFKLNNQYVIIICSN